MPHSKNSIVSDSGDMQVCFVFVFWGWGGCFGNPNAFSRIMYIFFLMLLSKTI